MSAKRLAPKEATTFIRAKSDFIRQPPEPSSSHCVPHKTLNLTLLPQLPTMGILDFISEITSAFSITPVDADAPRATDPTSASENQGEGEEKDVNSKEENSEDGGEEEGGEEQEEEEEEEEEEPEDIKPALEEGKSNSLTLLLSGLCLRT